MPSPPAVMRGTDALYLLLLLLCITVSLYYVTKRSSDSKTRVKNITVLVLGDLGRSPRILYQALSLSRAGFHVDLVGYAGTELFPEFKNAGNITVHHLPAPKKLFSGGNRILYILHALSRVVKQVAGLVWCLWFVVRPPSHLMIQVRIQKRL